MNLNTGLFSGLLNRTRSAFASKDQDSSKRSGAVEPLEARIAPATFTNSTGLTFNNPDPDSQSLNVSGMNGIISSISITINGLTESRIDDLDFLLVAPDGVT